MYIGEKNNFFQQTEKKKRDQQINNKTREKWWKKKKKFRRVREREKNSTIQKHSNMFYKLLAPNNPLERNMAKGRPKRKKKNFVIRL